MNSLLLVCQFISHPKNSIIQRSAHIHKLKGIAKNIKKLLSTFYPVKVTVVHDKHV